MKETATTPRAPKGLMRLMLRMPIWLYRLRMGWLLGKRFVMFTHIGRRSGLPRQTVVEVVDYDAAKDQYIIASGWGEHTDWLRNIQKTPRVLLDTGRRRVEATATRLPVHAAAEVLHRYAQKHPAAFRQLGRFMSGQPLTSSFEDCQRLANIIPLIALQPRPA